MERTPKIEKVNVDGGRFIREAKVNDSILKFYIGFYLVCGPHGNSLQFKIVLFRNYGMRSVSFISDKLTISLTNCKRSRFQLALQLHYDKITI